MNRSAIGSDLRLGRKAFKTGLNMALFMACGPALANAPVHHGTGPVSSWAHHSQLPNLPQTYVHTFGAHPTTAATLPLTTGLALPTNVQLDLTSTIANIVLQNSIVSSGATATINVGGVPTTFHTGDKVTAAELVAIYQTQTGGQHLQLDATGRADGGSFSLNRILGVGSPFQTSDLTIPQNVKAFDFLNSKSNITLSGDLLNYGSIIDFSHKSNLSATINAVNIVNESSGIITTLGHSSKAQAVDLALNAANDFTNYGTINGSGALTISAGNILTNASTHGGGLISAAGDINLQAPQMTNSGQVTSTAGNINLNSPTSLAVNNVGGTFSAAAGAINLRDASYDQSFSSAITGGNLLSQQLNINAGGGTANVNVDQLTGTVNSMGEAVHLQAATDTLVLGSQNIVGDPTYFNSLGSITINGDINVTGEDVTIIAAQNIIGTPSLAQINVGDGTNGHNLTMIAGADVTGNVDQTPVIPGVAATANVSVNGPSAAGGNVDLSLCTSLAINTGGSNSSGDVTMAAFSSGGFNGHVYLPVASSSISTSVGGPSGNVTLIAGAADKSNAIELNTIGTAPGAIANNVSILNYQPVITGGPLIYDKTGALVPNGASLGADFTQPGGSNISVTGAIKAVGQVYVGGGGDVSIQSINCNNLVVTAGGSISFSGLINAVQGVLMIASSNVTISGGMGVTNGAATVISGAKFSADGTNVAISGASGASNSNIVVNNITAAQIGVISFGNATTGQISMGGSTLDAGPTGSIGIVSGYDSALGDAITSTGTFKTSTGSIFLSTSTPEVGSGVAIPISNPFLTNSFFLGGPISSSAKINVDLTKVGIAGGSMLYAQGAPIMVSTANFVPGSLQNLTLYSGNDVTISKNITNANSLVLLANGNINIDTSGGPLTLNNTLGVSMIAGKNVQITGNQNLTISTGNAGTAGSVAIVSGAAFTYDGTLVTVSGGSATGGNISFDGAGKLTGINTKSGTATSGNVTLVAFGNSNIAGFINLPATSTIQTGASSGQNNGDVIAVAGVASSKALVLGDIDSTNGNPSGLGGNVSLESGTPETTTPLQFNSSGLMQSGSPVNLGNLNTNSDIAVGNITASGRVITLDSSRNITAGSLDASGVNAGSVLVLEHGNVALDLFSSGGTGTNFLGPVNVSATNPTAPRGEISIINNDDAGFGFGGIVVHNANAIVMNGAFAGSLALIAGGTPGDVIDLGPLSSIALDASAPGRGADITIQAFSLTWDNKATTPLQISVNGNGLLSGGSISVSTANRVNLDLSNASTYKFSANGGIDGTGGFVTIENGASIIYNQAGGALSFGHGANSGGGGSLELDAGYFLGTPIFSPSATLQIIGSLHSDGGGAGNDGGNFTLKSNSTTAFNIGSTKNNFNGVTGTITVNSATGGAPGVVQIVNAGGGVTFATALTNVSEIDATAGGSVGNISVGAPLGGAATNLITLVAAGTGSVTQTSNKNVVTSDPSGRVSIQTDPSAIGSIGGKTAFTVNTPDIELLATGSVNAVDSAPGTIVLRDSVASTGSFTFVASAAGSVLQSNRIDAMTGLTVTAGSINLSNNMAAGGFNSKAVVTALTGDITGSAFIDGGTVTITAAKGLVNILGAGVPLFTSAVSITALKSITVDDVGAASNVTLKTTGKGSGLGDITITDSVHAVDLTNTNGVAVVSASGNINSNGAEIVGIKSATVTAAGNIDVGGVFGSGTNTVTAGGALTIDGAAARDAITLKAGGKVTVTDTIQLSGNSGTISITSTNSSIDTTAADIDGGKTITMSATKGSISAADTGDIRTGAVTLTALNAITAGHVQAVNSFTAKSTAATGSILVTGDINVTSATGTVSLTAGDAGAGSAIETDGGIQAAKSVSVSAKGAIAVTSIGSFGQPAGPVTISGGSGILANGNIVSSGNIVIKSTTTTSKDIGLFGDVEALSPTASVTVTTTGTSDSAITSGMGADVSGGKGISFTASKGGIGLFHLGTIFATDKITASALNVVDQGGNAVATTSITYATSAKTDGGRMFGIGLVGDATTISSSGVIKMTTAGNLFSLTNGNISAGKSVTVSAGTGMSLGGTLQTTGGPISLVTNAGPIDFLGLGNVLANSGSTSSKATILIQTKDGTNGAININNGNTIATAGLGGSTVNIAVGAVTKGTNTNTPTNVTPSASPPNNIFYGAPGLIAAFGTNFITAKGADVIFSGTKAGAITLKSSVITADPPAGAVVVTSHTISAPTVAASIASGLQAAASPAPVANFVLANTAGAFSQGALSGISALNAVSAYRAPMFNWISETEINQGEIPVKLLSNGVLDLDDAPVADVSIASEASSTLGRGTVLAAPKTATTVHTKYGDVSMHAGSLVMIMALQHGLAVYNLHDTHQGAVAIRVGNRQINVRPGTSSVVVIDQIRAFEHINPAQLICYRNMKEEKLAAGLKAYHAEFAMPTALNAIKPLRAMIASPDRTTRKMGANFLKTMAILNQLQAYGEPFRQIVRPVNTAYLP